MKKPRPAASEADTHREPLGLLLAQARAEKIILDGADKSEPVRTLQAAVASSVLLTLSVTLGHVRCRRIEGAYRWCCPAAERSRALGDEAAVGSSTNFPYQLSSLRRCFRQRPRPRDKRACRAR